VSLYEQLMAAGGPQLTSIMCDSTRKLQVDSKPVENAHRTHARTHSRGRTTRKHNASGPCIGLNKFSVANNVLCQVFVISAKKELESCFTDVQLSK